MITNTMGIEVKRVPVELTHIAQAIEDITEKYTENAITDIMMTPITHFHLGKPSTLYGKKVRVSNLGHHLTNDWHFAQVNFSYVKTVNSCIPINIFEEKIITSDNSGYMVRKAKALLSQIAKATSYIRKRCTKFLGKDKV